MRRRALALVTVLALVLGAVPAERAGAADVDRILGEWRTPGGNVIDIRRDPNGAYRGYLIEVTDGARATGFKADQVSVNVVGVTGREVRFRVGVRVDVPDLKDRCPLV